MSAPDLPLERLAATSPDKGQAAEQSIGWLQCVEKIRFFIDKVASSLDETEALKLAVLSASCYRKVCDDDQ